MITQDNESILGLLDYVNTDVHCNFCGRLNRVAFRPSENDGMYQEAYMRLREQYAQLMIETRDRTLRNIQREFAKEGCDIIKAIAKVKSFE